MKVAKAIQLMASAAAIFYPYMVKFTKLYWKDLDPYIVLSWIAVALIAFGYQKYQEK